MIPENYYTSLYVLCDPLVILENCYTFLYVLCDPLVILGNCYTFLYVPYTFRIRSALFLLRTCPEVIRSYTFRATPLAILANCVAKLYVPIRAENIPTTFLQVILKSAITKLYVPIRTDYVPMTFLQVIFQYVSKSYTFQYVPSQLCS